MESQNSPIVGVLMMSPCPSTAARCCGGGDLLASSGRGLRGSTEKMYEELEGREHHSHRHSDSPDSQDEPSVVGCTTQSIPSRVHQHTSIISDARATFPREARGVLGARESGSASATSGPVVATTNRPKSSHAGNQVHQLKPAEAQQGHKQHQSTIDDKPGLEKSSQQELSSNIPLASLPQDTPKHNPSRTATAAEIALGVSYAFRQHTMPQAGPSQATGSNKRTATCSPSAVSYSTHAKDSDEHFVGNMSDTRTSSQAQQGPPFQDSSLHEASELPRVPADIQTPSTVSTDPSTDDASFGNDYKLDSSLVGGNLLDGTSAHSRSDSWGDAHLLPGPQSTPPRSDMPRSWADWADHSDAMALPNQAWGRPNHSYGQQRVASFRDPSPYGQPPIANPSLPWQQHSHPSTYAKHPFQDSMQFPAPGARLPSQGQSGRNLPQPSRPQKNYGPPPPGNAALAGTPPRARNNRQPNTPSHLSSRPQHMGSVGAGQHLPPNNNSARSSSEILKTLLRKKACLYEPDTSRAVALVTWFVGRELALTYGFFSRQQLQSGVHACVASKINSGTITRTKVNRCMQIILNSCFHYIIPRSDGSEENGGTFCVSFGETVKDDTFLLKYLPGPWRDLEVNRDAILEASSEVIEDQPHSKAPSTPKSSPRLTSMEPTQSPVKDSEDYESKRAVLLCFNENVRSAEDVFRCHNEFIRDTANAANLQLTAQDWRAFFGFDAARAPYLWGNVGIPIPTSEAPGGASRIPDAFGQMSEDEAAKFRTSWCAKRYEHDHELCGFAHVEINGGWLRRNPSKYLYNPDLCQFISKVADGNVSPFPFVVNECPQGLQCGRAHSVEEIMYHPQRYKRNICGLIRSGSCALGDVCPSIHPAESLRVGKKSEGRPFAPSRYHKKNDAVVAGGKGFAGPPASSPMIYASPAPMSSFDRHLGMPGLQSLFRRHSAVVRDHMRTSGKHMTVYKCFGDS
eukprot:Nitzschia sp. Nitz4//scaffold96_size78090//40680//43586//NITZ4_005496-RA/size78090-processed-gene-0.54-mRNA-1//-1//CDS//3329560579//3185//frame0